MNPLHDKIRSIVQPMLNAIQRPLRGRVIAYSNANNVARVEVPSPVSAGTMVLDDVPVMVVGGMHTPGPFPGDEVWVIFVGGNLNLPIIIGVGDQRYGENTRENRIRHRRKGAYVPNKICRRKNL